MKKKWLFYALIVLFAALAVFAGMQLYRIYHGYNEGEAVYHSLEQYVALPEPTTPSAPEPNNTPTALTEPTEPIPARDWPAVDFAALEEINPDIVAWILCEGTAINYPVVRGQDNSYYLTHLFDGTTNSAGSIFLDYRCAPDFSDISSTIYGHHMKDGSMFSAITEYRTQEYYDAHPQLLLLTPTENYVIEVFSAYVTDVHSDAWTRTFASDADYAGWIAQTKALSCFESDVTPTVEERIVTLSTCTYEFENARFVLVGVLR